jgi:hypothetical protein
MPRSRTAAPSRLSDDRAGTDRSGRHGEGERVSVLIMPNRAGLERALGGVSMLVVDLSDVTFIGSIAAAIVIDVLQNRSDVQVLKILSGYAVRRCSRWSG